MEPTDWRPRKPYDIRQRLFEFACLIIRLSQFLHTRGPVAAALAAQVVKCGTSAGANYEEADDGSSDRDKLAKKRIVLRELKETSYRLRLLRDAGLLLDEQMPLLDECAELIRILATIIRNDSVRL